MCRGHIETVKAQSCANVQDQGGPCQAHLAPPLALVREPVGTREKLEIGIASHELIGNEPRITHATDNVRRSATDSQPEVSNPPLRRPHVRRIYSLLIGKSRESTSRGPRASQRPTFRQAEPCLVAEGKTSPAPSIKVLNHDEQIDCADILNFCFTSKLPQGMKTLSACPDRGAV